MSIIANVKIKGDTLEKMGDLRGIRVWVPPRR
jgi:hypothetical protein